jgi:hypothetical protein
LIAALTSLLSLLEVERAGAQSGPAGGPLKACGAQAGLPESCLLLRGLPVVDGKLLLLPVVVFEAQGGSSSAGSKPTVLVFDNDKQLPQAMPPALALDIAVVLEDYGKGLHERLQPKLRDLVQLIKERPGSRLQIFFYGPGTQVKLIWSSSVGNAGEVTLPDLPSDNTTDRRLDTAVASGLGSLLDDRVDIGLGAFGSSPSQSSTKAGTAAATAVKILVLISDCEATPVPYPRVSSLLRRAAAELQIAIDVVIFRGSTESISVCTPLAQHTGGVLYVANSEPEFTTALERLTQELKQHEILAVELPDTSLPTDPLALRVGTGPRIPIPATLLRRPNLPSITSGRQTPTRVPVAEPDGQRPSPEPGQRPGPEPPLPGELGWLLVGLAALAGLTLWQLFRYFQQSRFR